jgi:uncharacterized protein (DUF58 family)
MDDKLRQLLRRVNRLEIRTRSSIGDLGAGLYRSRFRGQGMEFDQVREYSPGDDVRNIDWNVTARANKPYVKTYREERELSIMVLTDLSGSMRYGGIPGMGSQTKLLTAVEVTAIIAITAMRNNDRVGMIGFTDRTEAHHPCRRGRNHVMRLLRDLLAIEPASRSTDTAGALAGLHRLKLRRGICVLISDFINPDPDLARSLRMVRRKHEVVGFRIVDPAEEELPAGPEPLVLHDTEGRAVRVLRASRRGARRYDALWRRQQEEVEQDFLAANCDLVDCRTDASAFNAIRNYFRRRRRLVRA